MDISQIFKRHIMECVYNDKWMLADMQKTKFNNRLYTYINTITSDSYILNNNNKKIYFYVTPKNSWYSAYYPKVSIGLQSSNGSGSFNALCFGFTKWELIKIRCILYFKSYNQITLLRKEGKYTHNPDLLSASISEFLDNNRDIIRGSTLDDLGV
jgi:hypothetical protein